MDEDGRLQVPPFESMSDENIIGHLERRHREHLKLEVKPEPGKKFRAFRCRPMWEIYHAALHKFAMSGDDHFHRGAS